MAGNLRIINMRTQKPREGEILVRCDRQSVLGNPFYMQGKSPAERIKVCDQYTDYFNTIVGIKPIEEGLHTEYLARLLLKATTDPSFTARFKAELNRISELLKDSDVALGCWCHPLRCHVDTIYNYLAANN